jgi:hypothetical protein
MTSTATISHEAEVDGRIATAYTAWVDALAAHARLAQKATCTESWYARYAAEAAELLPASQDKVDATEAAYGFVAAEYKGWSRFYLVTNSNGHVHSSMSCTTCYPTTSYNWLTSLSGQSEAAVVAEYGSQLCTVCFPSAPVEWTDGSTKGRQAQAAKAERDAAKAARAKAKTLKALSDDPRGVTVNYGGRKERLTTLAAAKQHIIEGLRYLRYDYGQFANAEADGLAIAQVLALRLIELNDRFPGEVKLLTPDEIMTAARKTAAKG